MKKLLAKTSMLLTIVLAFAGSANAVPITINMTADNILEDGGLCDDSSCTKGTGWNMLGGTPNFANWLVSDSIVVDLGPGTYWFAWHVTNLGDPASDNPAGLLAEILWPGGANHSSSGWEIYDFNTGNHIAFASEYGANGGANLWTTVNGGPVAGISPNASWIWSANNFANADRDLWFRTSITVTVPEPGTLGLLGVSLFAFGLVRRRRRA